MTRTVAQKALLGMILCDSFHMRMSLAFPYVDWIPRLVPRRYVRHMPHQVIIMLIKYSTVRFRLF